MALENIEELLRKSVRASGPYRPAPWRQPEEEESPELEEIR